MSDQLVIEVDQDSDICVLRISGRLATGANEDYLQTKAREIKGLGCTNLLVDIRELISIGSSGIGFFVDLYTSLARHAAGRLVLAGPSPHVREVLALTRVSTIIPIFDDRESAMAFLSPGSKSRVAGDS